MRVSTYTIPLKLEENKYLLINARTGVIDIVDKDIIELLHSIPDSSVREFLKEGGHLTELSPEEEVQEIKTMYNHYMQTHPCHQQHMLIVTYACNLQCPYCYLSGLQSKGRTWTTRVMDDTRINKVFEVIQKIDGNQPGRIILYGGEPLLTKNKPVVKKILQKGTNLEYPFTILTNGVSIVDFLDILEGSITLQITLDGPQHIHDTRRMKKDGSGTFDEIVAGIDALLEKELYVNLRINLDKENVTVLPQTLAFFSSKGWDSNPYVSMHFSPVFQGPGVDYTSFIPRKDVYNSVIFQTAQTPELSQISFDWKGIELFETILKGGAGPPRFWYCDAHCGMYIYDPFGDIYVCTEHVGEERCKVGTYYPELVWNDMYKKWRNRTIFTIPECRTCIYALFCGGGCGYEALTRYNTLSKPVCYDYKDIFANVIPHLYKLVRKNHDQP